MLCMAVFYTVGEGPNDTGTQDDLVDPRFTFRAVRLDETQSSGT